MDGGVKAEIDDSSGLYILSSPNAPSFTRLLGAIGWADPNHDDTFHALLVGGETSDKRFIIIHEFIGSFPKLINEAINIKDRLLIPELWLDIRERDLHIQLSIEDGLTHYESLGVDLLGREIWKHESSKWPYFRNRETIVRLFAIPNIVFSSGLRGIDRVVAMISSKELSLHSSCTLCSWVLEQHDVGSVLTHPIAKAMANLAFALKSGIEEPITNETRIIYPNLR